MARHTAPTDEVSTFAVGNLRTVKGDYFGALGAFEFATAEQGLNAETLAVLANANLYLNRLNQAEPLLRAAIEQGPNFVDAQNNLGILQMERENYDKARRLFEIAFCGDGDGLDNFRSAIAAVYTVE
ncbi:MAG: hypothetical protein KJP02_09590 [Octadecabacter sp.]|nr:hypothetical protein [Octadecabacter sp.]